MKYLIYSHRNVIEVVVMMADIHIDFPNVLATGDTSCPKVFTTHIFSLTFTIDIK